MKVVFFRGEDDSLYHISYTARKSRQAFGLNLIIT